MTLGAAGVYLAEVSVLLILFYIFNKQLLARETMHQTNRIIWLLSVFFSFALPFASSLSFTRGESSGLNVEILAGEISTEGEIIAASQSSIFTLSNFVNLLFIIYAIGVIAMLIYTLVGYISLVGLTCNKKYNLARSTSAEDRQLLQKLRGYQKYAGVEQNIRYVIHDLDFSPFSWFNSVVISRADLESGDREIVVHELAHTSQRHSLDVVLLDLVTIVLWFNPASWLTKKALQQVHEYCADNAVLSLGVNAKEYQLLLIRKAVGARLYSMSNSLNHSNLKNRITMMTKKKSPQAALAKCLYVVPVAIFAIIALASPVLADSLGAISKVEVANYFDQNKPYNVTATVEYQDPPEEEESFLRCEVMPTFQGGDLVSFRNWVMMNLRYPEKAAMNNVQGAVNIKFIVETDGSVSSVEVLRSPDPDLSAEAVRVILSSPKWTPGEQRGEKVKVTYTLPVVFAINNDTENAEAAQ
ncbi:MAG: M56 family metallopeptidase [Rikenellaceae bacterium]